MPPKEKDIAWDHHDMIDGKMIGNIARNLLKEGVFTSSYNTWFG